MCTCLPYIEANLFAVHFENVLIPYAQLHPLETTFHRIVFLGGDGDVVQLIHEQRWKTRQSTRHSLYPETILWHFCWPCFRECTMPMSLSRLFYCILMTFFQIALLQALPYLPDRWNGHLSLPRGAPGKFKFLILGLISTDISAASIHQSWQKIKSPLGNPPKWQNNPKMRKKHDIFHSLGTSV